MKNNVADIFKKYRQKLLAFIRDKVQKEEDAEDILQDVFLRLIQTEENTSILQISGWLYQVARNSIIDRNRKQQEERMPQIAVQRNDDSFLREVTEILVDEDLSPDKEYLRTLVWEELEKALSELPPEQRIVFEQTELQGITFKELSASSGIAVKTLLSRKHYAGEIFAATIKKSVRSAALRRIGEIDNPKVQYFRTVYT